MEAISLEEKRIEREHVKLITNDSLRKVVSKAIEESFGKALEKAKKDTNFKTDGEAALLAIETRVFEHFSKSAARTLINNLSNGIGSFINKVSKG